MTNDWDEWMNRFRDGFSWWGPSIRWVCRLCPTRKRNRNDHGILGSRWLWASTSWRWELLDDWRSLRQGNQWKNCSLPTRENVKNMPRWQCFLCFSVVPRCMWFRIFLSQKVAYRSYRSETVYPVPTQAGNIPPPGCPCLLPDFNRMVHHGTTVNYVSHELWLCPY